MTNLVFFWNFLKGLGLWGQQTSQTFETGEVTVRGL